MSHDYGDFANYLGRVARRLEDRVDPQLLSAVAAPLFMADVAKCFARAVDPYGNPWAPAKKPDRHPLLIRTGRMMRAAIAAAGSVKFDVAETMYVNDTEPMYLRFQRLGTRSIPAREFLQISTETWVKIDKVVHDEMKKRVNGEGVN